MGRGLLLLLLAGLSVELSVHGAGGLKDDEPRRSQAGRSQRRAVLRRRARLMAVKCRVVRFLLGGRPVWAGGTIVRHGLTGYREKRRSRVQGRLVRMKKYRVIGTTGKRSQH